MRFILLLIIMVMQTSYAKVADYQTNNFADINHIYQKSVVNPKTTLLVFDLDDTLMTMTQPLGSVGWWDWQEGLQKSAVRSEKLFTSNPKQLVRIQNILFQLIKMEVTDQDAIPFIKNSVKQGTLVMGLTARGKEHLSATFMQLNDNQFTSNGNLIFKEYGVKFADKTSVAENFVCPQFTRDVIYQNGVMFLDGEDKGEALSCVLTKSKQKIETVIFVDDAVKNTQSVARAFASRNDVNVINILFTKENAKEDEIRANIRLQNQMIKQWKEIQGSLHAVITQSNF